MGARKKSNPPLMVVGNPDDGAVRFSQRVRRLEYEHEHEPDDVDAIRVHDFGPGVEMWALEDGSVLLRHPSKPLWEEFPD